MFSMLALSVLDRVFETRSDQTKDYKIGIYCFPAKDAASRNKSKDWLTRNQNNIYIYMYIKQDTIENKSNT